MKILVVYYSMYGHIYKMAQAVAEGAGQVEGVSVALRRVPETLPEAVLEKMGAIDAQKEQAKIEICTIDELGASASLTGSLPTICTANGVGSPTKLLRHTDLRVFLSCGFEVTISVTT